MLAASRLPARLLIADDDVALRDTLVEMVQPYVQPIAVGSAEAAIEVMGTTVVDVALFDMNMSVLTGLDAIRWLRAHRLTLPCILMSAHVTAELETHAQQLAAFSVLRKPLGRTQLLDTIHCALEL